MASTIRQSALTFRLSCWVLGMIAFGQLLAAGVAVAVRVERAQEVRVEEKVVTKVVTVGAPAPKPAKVVAVAPPSPSSLPPMPVATPLPPARPLAAPPIADPVVERLVNEARAARIADDMATAITKLDDARDTAPKEPGVLYEIGLTYEHMAQVDPRFADQAADAYQEVFSLGTTGAGALYELAAQKLRDGIEMPEAKRDELRLGRVRDYRDEDFKEGQRVLVDVPVQAAPGTEINANDLVVKVNFFDSTMKNGKKEIQPAAEGLCQTVFEWVSGEFDFLGGEETLRVTYILPPQEIQQDHIFGKRTYYGQTVELYYKEELIDSVASPRHLSSRSSVEQRPEDTPDFIDAEDMIDINPGNLLLPPRQGDMPNLPMPNDPNGALPPLPER
jgi:hypothetical protein